MKKMLKGLVGLWGAVALTAPAHADVEWLVNAVFAGGGTLTGTFRMNASHYISLSSLSSNGPDGFKDYTAPFAGTSVSSGDTWIDIATGNGTGDLYLDFSGLIDSDPSTVLLVTASSFECQGNSYCFAANHLGDFEFAPQTVPAYRFLSGTAIGSAADTAPYDGPSGGDSSPTPEPATWGMMILGFGMTGTLARRRRVRAAA